MENEKLLGVRNICGGLNPYSDRANTHSEKYYESIRRQRDDCIRIVKNTHFTLEQISMIKSHIFYTYHALSNNRFDRFAPSYEMAESWRRLSENGGKHIQPHDIILLNHELLEIKYLWEGYHQSDAHVMASKAYNYSRASIEFYRRMGFSMR